MNIDNFLNKYIDGHFKEILKKGGIALFIRVIGFIGGYLFMYLVVKDFGSDTQGRIALSFSIMIIGSLFCRLGLDTHFVKIFAIPNNFNNAKGLYLKILPGVCIGSGLLSVIIFIFSDTISLNIFKDQELGIFLKWTAPTIFLYTILLLNAGVLRGLRKNAIYSFLFNGGRFSFAVCILIVLLGFDNNYIYAVIAHTTSVFILLLISFYYILKYLGVSPTQTTYKTLPFIKDSIPMLFSASMIVFLGWSDTLILGIYKESDQVGIYSVILKVAIVTSFTMQALDSILAPKLSEAFHSGSKKEFKRMVKNVTLLNFIVSFVVVVLIISFREMILDIFGEEFKVASLALIILCVGQLFNAISGPVGSILQMTGNQQIFQNILLVALVINIIINLSLVKDYGLSGVAIGTAFSLIIWKTLGIIYIKKKALY